MQRRLPVLQTQSPEDVLADARPKWQWSLIGAGFVLTLWLPLAMISVWLWPGAVLVAFSFVVASALSGILIGRFGGRARVREAALGGAIGALAGWLLALSSGGLRPWSLAVSALLMLLLLGSAGAALGGRLGLRLKARANQPKRTKP
jgi:hypothetical protein